MSNNKYPSEELIKEWCEKVNIDPNECLLDVYQIVHFAVDWAKENYSIADSVIDELSSIIEKTAVEMSKLIEDRK